MSVESLVDRMFDRVLEPIERAELLIRIQAWEAANPGVDNARRDTGWIDVAYEFQAQQRTVVETRNPVRRPAVVGSWFPASATARPTLILGAVMGTLGGPIGLLLAGAQDRPTTIGER